MRVCLCVEAAVLSPRVGTETRVNNAGQLYLVDVLQRCLLSATAGEAG